MNMQSTITKLGAARTLLDRALGMLLDEGDYMSAIVLAGSAEDIMQGLLNRESREGAREELVNAALKMQDDPNTVKPERIHGIVRGVFSWLRHADRMNEPQSITVDLIFEAVDVSLRALDNWSRLTGEPHPRDREFYEAVRNRRLT